MIGESRPEHPSGVIGELRSNMPLLLRDLLQVPVMFTSIDNEEFDAVDVEPCSKVSLASFTPEGLVMFKSVLDSEVVKIDYGAITIRHPDTKSLLQFCMVLNGTMPEKWYDEELLTDDHWT